MFNERGHWQKLPRMSASKKLAIGLPQSPDGQLCFLIDIKAP
ncbi:hypothetical protein BRO54_1197 [Geobacillus proteiniphilus]|uniref:Uncharacterized protein n=1 Tax=Geobacillus proteiniphilus TaxID=860353 RepID=A0A1Q5T433_9BACL|nr:hypothetical protein BRO54_1197 [Geobacillus proteiniphilus]